MQVRRKTFTWRRRRGRKVSEDERQTSSSRAAALQSNCLQSWRLWSGSQLRSRARITHTRQRASTFMSWGVFVCWKTWVASLFMVRDSAGGAGNVLQWTLCLNMDLIVLHRRLGVTRGASWILKGFVLPLFPSVCLCLTWLTRCFTAITQESKCTSRSSQLNN